MRAVLTLVIILGSITAILFAVSYLGPWLQSEMSVGIDSSEPVSSLPSAQPSPVPEYDSMGLPVYSEEICLFLVNKDNPAKKNFTPELAEVSGIQVDARIASALRLLSTAAKEEGLALVFTEGYVSYERQEQRFQAAADKLIQEDGLTTVMAKAEAEAIEPQPGESDFQSGMCVRLAGDPKTFEDSRTYSWLKANMGKYGFIFRYPKYKEDATGVEADPTVIRYVGSASAAAMQQRSLCLEEYITYLNSQ